MLMSGDNYYDTTYLYICWVMKPVPKNEKSGDDAQLGRAWLILAASWYGDIG